ncbi:MAG: hypothetical protein GDA52_03060 [Rhodobacteraceae bacterium]|nr:hypothetical protein [Paracoccaceae bacterium]
MKNPITIRGVTYPSQAAAARALGVSTSSVARLARRGEPDSIGIGTKSGQPITIRGVTYPSQAAAARALGISRQAVNDATRTGRLERCGLGWPPSR